MAAQPFAQRARRFSALLLRALALATVFGLGMLVARVTAPQEASAVVLRTDGDPDFYLPVSSRQLTVTLQPLVPSAAVEKLLLQRHGETQATARALAGGPGLEALAADLAELYPLSYAVAPQPLVIPDDCFDAERQQYSTTRLLSWLAKRAAPQSFRTAGLLYADVYDEGYNFLFGQARLAGAVCVASSSRMGSAAGSSRMTPQERWHSIVRHELGHTLGLQHVADEQSVMAFGNSLAELDTQGTELTPADWKTLKALHPIRWEK